MLELLNQMDGFDARGDVKVRITNKTAVLTGEYPKGYHGHE